MTLTAEQLLEGFSRFIGDWWSSTTTAAGTTTELYDTALGFVGDNMHVDNWFRITSGTADNQIRRALPPFNAATGGVTVQPAYSAAIDAAVTYEMHRYHPQDKWAALDAARLAVLKWVFKEVRDDTLMGDGRSDEFRLPSAVEWGPEFAFIEDPLPPDADWNLIDASNARGKAVEDWSASANVTASTYARTTYDKRVPKHEDTCVKLVYTDNASDGTYTLSTFRSGVSASALAARRVEFGIWVHSEVAGVVAEIVTDAGTLETSSAHQGGGWEFLTASDDMPQTAPSSVSVRVRFPTGGTTRVVYVENAFFVLGRLPSMFHDEAAIDVSADNTLRLVQLRGIPPERRQIRLIGKAPLTAVGTANPATGSMEVDEKSAQILYAEAAEQLFGLELLNQPAQRDVLARIAAVRDRRKEYQQTWKYRSKQGRLVSPFAW